MIQNVSHLGGLRVLNTRPLEQGKNLSDFIHKIGGISWDLPALVIEETNRNWISDLPNLDTVSHIIFISANAVNFFLNALKKISILWPKTLCVVAIGRATATALMKHGIVVDYVPSFANSEHLLALGSLQIIEKQTILLIKGENGRAEIAKTLLKRGADLISLDVYRRGLPTLTDEYQALWHNNAVDIILFTSEQGMHNVFALFGKKARDWLCNKPCLVISERLALAASSLGMQNIIQCYPEEIAESLICFANNGHLPED